MRNPYATLPGGGRITASDAAKSPLDHDYGCPTCSQRLQLLGRHSSHPDFPRFEHLPGEADHCDWLLLQRGRAA